MNAAVGRGGRFVAGGAALVVVVIVLVLLLGGGSSYKVTATFVTASQLVKGDQVKVAGAPIGTVKDIRLTDDGRAAIDLSIDKDGYHPLRRGTRATVRQTSLSGVASRYVDLQLGGADGAEIPDGGDIPAVNNQAAVDLDQLFDVFDPKTRRSVSTSIESLRDFTAGRTDEANAALRYLNPALASSSMLFAQLNGDRRDFERFIDASAHLVTDAASRDDALAGLVRNLAATTDALADRRGRLGEAVGVLPTFLHKANSTFVNLNRALDGLTPLVDDAKPIVRTKLIPLMDQLRPFARGAVPTITDLSKTIRRPGADNDLVELLRRQPSLDRVANRRLKRNGKTRPGAFPVTQQALKGAAPQLGSLRPYTPDFVGWMDDFSTTGAYDAYGNFSRAGLTVNGFSLGPLLNVLQPVPPELRNAVLSAGVVAGRNNRCPGSDERRAADGSNPYVPPADISCDPTQVPIGP